MAPNAWSFIQRSFINRKHPSVLRPSSAKKSLEKTPEDIISHGVLSPLASRDVIISSQICGWKLQRVSHIR